MHGAALCHKDMQAGAGTAALHCKAYPGPALPHAGVHAPW